MGNDGRKQEQLYGVVEVIKANRDGSGKFVLMMEPTDNRFEAKAEAKKLGVNCTAVPLPQSDKKYQEGDVIGFDRGDSKDLDQVTERLNKSREAAKEDALEKESGPSTGREIAKEFDPEGRGR